MWSSDTILKIYWIHSPLKNVFEHHLCFLGDLDRECDFDLCFFFLCDLDFDEECLSNLPFDFEFDRDLDRWPDLFGDLECDLFLLECDADLWLDTERDLDLRRLERDGDSDCECFFLLFRGDFDLSRECDRRSFDFDKDGDDDCLFLFGDGDRDLDRDRERSLLERGVSSTSLIFFPRNSCLFRVSKAFNMSSLFANSTTPSPGLLLWVSAKVTSPATLINSFSSDHLALAGRFSTRILKFVRTGGGLGWRTLAV